MKDRIRANLRESLQANSLIELSESQVRELGEYKIMKRGDDSYTFAVKGDKAEAVGIVSYKSQLITFDTKQELDDFQKKLFKGGYDVIDSGEGQAKFFKKFGNMIQQSLKRSLLSPLFWIGIALTIKRATSQP